MSPIKHGIDYSQITKEIYLGTNACCQMHFEQELLSKGIRADISLEAEHQDDPLGVDSFLWLPTQDHTAPSQQSFDLGIQALTYFTDHHIPVYVHCKNGHGRGTTLIAAFLMKSRELTLDHAIDLIRQKRPTIHLEDAQVDALKRLFE